MALTYDQMKLERENLKDTNTWINDEILEIEKSDKNLKDKIDSLRKQSKGKYNEELETKEKLYEITHKNLEKYQEAKEQPYFGRVDFREYRREKEAFYIGKFGLGDMTTGDEKVIDWRSPLADLYYSGTFGDAFYRAPMGVVSGELSLKRKFLIRDSELKDAFDEGINEIILKSSNEEGNSLIDDFLRINLEESVSSKLKDVVATIQKEQNEIIRAEKNTALIVQGSAGSGKTTVALHRLAYLLYKYKEKLDGNDILVIAPNKLFLDYISDVLPDLGVSNVKQRTFEEIAFEILSIKAKALTKDKKLSDILEEKDTKKLKFITNSSKLRGTILYKTLMDRYVKYMEIKDLDIEDIKVENYTLFVKKEIQRLYAEDMAHLALNKRKDEIKRYFNLKIDEKINSILEKIDFSYEYQIARVKKTMEDGIERRKKLIELYDERDSRKSELKAKSRESFEYYFSEWKQIDTGKLYMDFLNNEELFAEETSVKIPKEIIKYIRKELSSNFEKGIIDSDDLASMLYLKFKIEGVPDKYKYKHIVIDEAQDYSIFQIAVLKEMVLSNSLTIVGDIGQGIYYYRGIEQWEKLIDEVFKEEATYVQLTQSYRSTVEIIEFANMVLMKQKNKLKPAMPVLRHGKTPEVLEFKTNREFGEKLDEIVAEVEKINKKSVAVIGRNYDECKKIKDHLKKYSNYNWDLIKDTDKNLKLEKIIIPSYMTKGLEFDCSVIYNCNKENYSDNELDKKILYVALTRALHLEYIFYNGEKSKLI
ncbi:RNA polymerase recycling motor HelD [Clostridium magnum]|uniref:Helicase IV n=1 Tax=Clostridium magnum DSM 2767 TaxID=1121326 RepID=A0A162QQ77_9CLOT|nr:RNA polymerase recycling motor HelD [Clostridium magnum]KZL88817.1 helicase IV [Clostridium magnum DSM 2767]SHI77684.1 DNA helicase-2 / ATP-dependent DNA helicase PcrA [Clostridium magnum DSM 2767]